MKVLKLKTHHFHTKPPYQRPMLRQIEWWVKNESILRNRVLLVTTLFFWKFCFSLRTSFKELIWCTNEPKAHIRTFCKRWSFIWQCFFSVSILNRPSIILSLEIEKSSKHEEKLQHWRCSWIAVSLFFSFFTFLSVRCEMLRNVHKFGL